MPATEQRLNKHILVIRASRTIFRTKQSKRVLPRCLEASVLDISCGFIFPLTLIGWLPQSFSKPVYWSWINTKNEWRHTLFHYSSQPVSLIDDIWIGNKERNMNPLDLSRIYSFTIFPWPSKTVSSFTFSEKTSTLLSVPFPGMVIDLSLHKRSAAVGHLICLSALIKLKLMTDMLCWEPNIGYIVTSH